MAIISVYTRQLTDSEKKTEMKVMCADMSEYTDLSFETECEQDEFDRFVDGHELGSLLQQTRWHFVKANWNSRRIVVRQNGEIKASALILIRRIGLGFSLFYIPRGPVIDYKDHKLCSFFFTQLKKYGYCSDGIKAS